MRATRTLAAIALTIPLLLSACGSGSDEATRDTATTAAPDGTPADGGATTAPDAGGSDGGSDAPASGWLAEPITDVDGETFTIASLAGRPVFVEMFATWCSNCLEQLGKTQEAAAEVGDDAVVLALSVETDLDPADVAAYADDNGFDDIRFAVMSPELLAAVQQELGTTALNPPSTPKVVVGADGSVGELVTGSEDPDEILAALAA